MVLNSCYCSKSSAVSRRCSNKTWSCNKTCNKLLACKQHLCQDVCHKEKCGDCQKTSIQFCKCKKKRKEVLCTQTVWQCEQANLSNILLKIRIILINDYISKLKKCLKPYLCGYHQCELECHEGKCGECPKSLIRTCPCEKTSNHLF